MSNVGHLDIAPEQLKPTNNPQPTQHLLPGRTLVQVSSLTIKTIKTIVLLAEE